MLLWAARIITANRSGDSGPVNQPIHGGIAEAFQLVEMSLQVS